MAKKTAQVNIDEVVAGLLPLLKADAAARFAIGDYLLQFNLTSADYSKISARTNVEVTSLKSYASVAQEFPPERRREHLAWGVYKNLARVSNEDGWQDTFLADRPSATAGEAERAANMKIRADRGRRTGSTRDAYRDTATVDGISANLEVQPGVGMGRVVLTGVEVAEFRQNDFAGTFEIEFKFSA